MGVPACGTHQVTARYEREGAPAATIMIHNFCDSFKILNEQTLRFKKKANCVYLPVFPEKKPFCNYRATCVFHIVTVRQQQFPSGKRDPSGEESLSKHQVIVSFPPFQFWKA